MNFLRVVTDKFTFFISTFGIIESINLSKFNFQYTEYTSIRSKKMTNYKPLTKANNPLANKIIQFILRYRKT